ncbi:MAG TPA: ferredoxin [Ignavibacteriaceae bacterium]|nr:ferredoxin [Ignavibacteriaceae bacterium]
MNDLPEREVNGLTIIIDRLTCISTGNCIKVSPEVFEFDDKKICSFKIPYLDIEKERMIEACSVCPVNALTVIDEKGKKLVPNV